MEFQTTQKEFEGSGNFDDRLIPDGWYTFAVSDFKIGESKEKGYPQLGLTLDVEEAINNQDWSFNDRVFHTITLIPLEEKGHSIAVHWLKCLGFKPDATGKIDIDPDKLMCARIKAYVFIDEYQGKKRNKISKVEAIESAVESSDPQDVAEDDVPF